MSKLSRAAAYRGPRGSGRTTRLLKALPEGGLYLAQSDRMAKMFDAYLSQIGREGEIDVRVAHIHSVRGIARRPIAIDHCVIEEGIDDDLLHTIRLRSTVVLINDEEGDVLVLGGDTI